MEPRGNIGHRAERYWTLTEKSAIKLQAAMQIVFSESDYTITRRRLKIGWSVGATFWYSPRSARLARKASNAGYGYGPTDG